MSETPESGKPVVEPSPGPDKATEARFDELRYRIRQQELLSNLGVLALQGGPLDKMLDEAARTAAQGLNAEFSKILQILPHQGALRVVAGCGWEEDIVGQALIGADSMSPAGYALETGQPVISNHLGNESRFRTPELLAKRGILRAINVILRGQKEPFGVLEVDSRRPGEFSEHDLTFLQGAANLIGIAIERRRYEEQLTNLLEHQEALLKEVNHRVKNSLQLVASLLRLQAGSVDSEEVKRLLGDAQARVMAIARAHERLYRTADVADLDVGVYIGEVCGDLDGGALRFEGAEGIRIATDRAIPIALLVSELVTNSMKYAYPNREQGPVWVKVAPAPGDFVRVSVADEGVGLPEDFDPECARTLGMRLVRSFAQRLGASLEFHRLNPGTEVELLLPREENGEGL